MTMTKKELLRKNIEMEREKLNSILAGGGKVEDAYTQSLVVDHLLEQYMDCEYARIKT